MPSQTSIEDLGPDDPPKPTGGKKASSSSKASKTRAKNDEKDLKERLTNLFDRIADALKERGDSELGDIFEEDAEVMASGLVSLTRPLVVLRKPLVIVVALVEPILSFGRVVRVLIGRLAERRMRIADEREAALRDGEGDSQPGV